MDQNQLQTYYSLLSEEITDTDCGELCRTPGGRAYCCDSAHFLPLLFASEKEFLNREGDVWQEYTRLSPEEKTMQETLIDQKFCVCGFSSCQRDLRSLSCRTYPLEPYIDQTGAFYALTFISTASELDRRTGKVRCPLTQRKERVRQAFVDRVFAFYMQLFAERPGERQIYRESSRKLRERHRRTGLRLVLLKPRTLIHPAALR